MTRSASKGEKRRKGQTLHGRELIADDANFTVLSVQMNRNGHSAHRHRMLRTSARTLKNELIWAISIAEVRNGRFIKANQCFVVCVVAACCWYCRCC